MARGDGSFQEWNGGYRYFVSWYCDVDDEIYRLSVVGKTQTECRRKMIKKKEQKREEILLSYSHSLDNKQILLKDALNTWLKEEKMGKIKMSTYDRYERTIENNISKSDIGGTRVARIKSKDILHHLEHLLVDNSESTVKKVYELLKQFYRFYYSRNISANPMNDVIMPKKKNVGEVEISLEDETILEDMVLSDDEIKKFREQCFLPYKKGAAGRPKHGPDLYFMLVTVIRYGEASALVWGDIDMDNRIMVVRRNQSVVKNRDGGSSKTRRILTTPKSGKSREVMLSKDALEALAEIKKRSHHTDDKDFVICSDSGKSLTNHNLRDALDGIMKTTGLNTGRRAEKFGLHYLRHTGISYYIRHGVPLEMVSKMAGHSSVAITERIYYHIIHDQQQKMLEMMDGID